jgi:hypothetical protein
VEKPATPAPRAAPLPPAASGKPAVEARPPASSEVPKTVSPHPPPAASAGPSRGSPGKGEEPKKVAEIAPPVPAAAEKARLKVLKPEPATRETEAPAPTLIGSPGPAGIGGPLDLSVKGRSARKFSMGAVNRGLAAAVLLILAFTAYEIWAAAKNQKSEVGGQRSEGGGQIGKGATTGTGSPAELADLASYVAPWKEKDIFYQTSVKTGGEQAKTPVAPPPELAGLAGRLKIMGFSKHPDQDARVILRDTKDDKMFIAAAGEKILVGGQPLELVQIHNDHVVLSDGKDSISISVK